MSAPRPHSEGLPTPRTALAARCRVAVICEVCPHVGRLDLAGLIRDGRGDTPLIRLPLRCACGSRKARIIVSGETGY